MALDCCFKKLTELEKYWLAFFYKCSKHGFKNNYEKDELGNYIEILFPCSLKGISINNPWDNYPNESLLVFPKDSNLLKDFKFEIILKQIFLPFIKKDV